MTLIALIASRAHVCGLPVVLPRFWKSSRKPRASQSHPAQTRVQSCLSIPNGPNGADSRSLIYACTRCLCPVFMQLLIDHHSSRFIPAHARSATT